MDIKALRKKKELSQIEIAEKLGVHVNTYILWERKAGKPSPENLRKLKAIFGMK